MTAVGGGEGQGRGVVTGKGTQWGAFGVFTVIIEVCSLFES